MYNLKIVFIMNTNLCKMSRTRIRRTATEEGQSIEQQLRKIIAEKQPIPQVLPEIFTDKKDGVIPDTDIRTDRWDVAMAAQDKWARSKTAKGAEAPTEPVTTESKEPKNDTQKNE